MDGRDLARMLALELADVIDEELALLASEDPESKDDCSFRVASSRPTTVTYGVSLVDTCEGKFKEAHPRHLRADFNKGERFTRDMRARWKGICFDQVVLVRRVLLAV